MTWLRTNKAYPFNGASFSGVHINNRNYSGLCWLLGGTRIWAALLARWYAMTRRRAITSCGPQIRASAS